MPEPVTVRELRRGQIVAAARSIVAADGLEALTFSALERSLAFTRGSITWHFRNKDAIVTAVLQDAVDEIDAAAIAAIRAEHTLADRARAVIREMVLGYLGESDAGHVLLAFWGRLRTDVDAAERNAELYARYRGYSSELIRIGQERGEFRADADADAIGAVIVALVLGISLQALFDPESVDVEAAVAAAGDAVVAVLR